MAILALDTAAGQCAVALLLDDNTGLIKAEPRHRGQSERLLPMVEALLAEARLDYAALTEVAVTTGPGSFTGLRVGLAAAQGLGLALSIPAIGIDSFTAFAEGNQSKQSSMIIIESRRAELYWRLLDEQGRILDPGGCDLPEAIAQSFPSDPFVLMGDGWHALHPYLQNRNDITGLESSQGPSPLAIARLAKALLLEGKPLPPALPLYIRPPDAKTPTR